MSYNGSPAREVLLAVNAIALWIVRATLHVSISKGRVSKMLATKLATHGWVQFTCCLVTALLYCSLETRGTELTSLELQIVGAKRHVTLAFQGRLEEHAAMLAVTLGTHGLVTFEFIASTPRPLPGLGHKRTAAISALEAQRNTGGGQATMTLFALRVRIIS